MLPRAPVVVCFYTVAMADIQGNADKKVNLGVTYEDTAIPPTYEVATSPQMLAAQPVRMAGFRNDGGSLHIHNKTRPFVVIPSNDVYQRYAQPKVSLCIRLFKESNDDWAGCRLSSPATRRRYHGTLTTDHSTETSRPMTWASATSITACAHSTSDPPCSPRLFAAHAQYGHPTTPA